MVKSSYFLYLHLNCCYRSSSGRRKGGWADSALPVQNRRYMGNRYRFFMALVRNLTRKNRKKTQPGSKTRCCLSITAAKKLFAVKIITVFLSYCKGKTLGNLNNFSIRFLGIHGREPEEIRDGEGKPHPAQPVRGVGRDKKNVICCNRRSPCRTCGPAGRRGPSSSAAERGGTWGRPSPQTAHS